jgi:hypothetical protein
MAQHSIAQRLKSRCNKADCRLQMAWQSPRPTDEALRLTYTAQGTLFPFGPCFKFLWLFVNNLCMYQLGDRLLFAVVEVCTLGFP